MSFKEHVWEIGAAAASVLGIVAFTVVPLSLETHGVPKGTDVITLTALAATGTWTDEAVDGENYWNRTFRPARPVLRVGAPVLLRLKSADVIHNFSCPDLRLGPVDVWPGHVVELKFTPPAAGVFPYYCTMVCGDAHFGMRGQFVAVTDGAPVPPPLPSLGEFWKTPAPPAGASRVEHGKWLFQERGCFACHGEGGKGGVANPNYLKDTVPALNTLAERMKLEEPEDAQAIIAQLEKGAPLSSLSSAPPMRRFNVVLAQYDAIRDVIRKGSPSGMKDPAGPPPPLVMPAWGPRLTDFDIDAIIAWLLTQQPWEEQEK